MKKNISFTLSEELITAIQEEAQLNRIPVSQYVEKLIEERTTHTKHTLNPNYDIGQIHNILLIYYNILETYYVELDKYTKAEAQRVCEQNKQISESLSNLNEKDKQDIALIHKKFSELDCINEVLEIDLDNHEAYLKFTLKYPDIKVSEIKKYRAWHNKKQTSDNIS